MVRYVSKVRVRCWQFHSCVNREVWGVVCGLNIETGEFLARQGTVEPLMEENEALHAVIIERVAELFASAFDIILGAGHSVFGLEPTTLKPLGTEFFDRIVDG